MLGGPGGQAWRSIPLGPVLMHLARGAQPGPVLTVLPLCILHTGFSSRKCGFPQDGLLILSVSCVIPDVSFTLCDASFLWYSWTCQAIVRVICHLPSQKSLAQKYW